MRSFCERSIEPGEGSSSTNKVRCFDFWRIDDVKPYRKPQSTMCCSKAAEKAAKQNILLAAGKRVRVQYSDGTRGGFGHAGRRADRDNLALNWDPGNAVMRGELDAFPVGFNMIPKDRIRHCHVKNAQKNAAGKTEWAPVDKGYVDWAAQFAALQQAGYRGAVSLETHWRGRGHAGSQHPRKLGRHEEMPAGIRTA